MLFLELMQIAESIERVKAVRKAHPNSESSNVPFILRRAHTFHMGQTKASTNSLKHHSNSLSGKEFLLAFDKCIKLEDTWVDASLFALFN